MRAHHFAHDDSADCVGAVESAIHCLEKEILTEVLYVKHPGNAGDQKFDRVETERYNPKLKLRPDCIGHYGDKVLWVEFKRTHEVDANKVSKIISACIDGIEIDLNECGQNKERLHEFITQGCENRKWIYSEKYGIGLAERANSSRNPSKDDDSKAKNKLERHFVLNEKGRLIDFRVPGEFDAINHSYYCPNCRKEVALCVDDNGYYSFWSVRGVKEATAKLRQEWDLGLSGIVNVISLFEEHGVKVLEINAPDSFDEMSSLVNEKFHIVILNKTFSVERKRFTALHELGHLVLRFPKTVDEKQEESLCHLFASEMLIPESELKRILGPARKDISYQELKAIQLGYGISCDAIMYKAKECGIISEQRYHTFCIQKNKVARFKALIERTLYHPEESTRFVSLVYKALSKELITISKAASLLHQDIEQVRKEFILI